MKAFFAILLIIVGVIAVWYWAYDDVNKQTALNTSPTPTYIVATSSPTYSVTGEPEPGTGGSEDVINFIRRGTLATSNNEWYLWYSLNSATYQIKLSFPADSVCVINGITSLCSDVAENFLAGLTVRAEGIFTAGNPLEVLTLTVLTTEPVSPAPAVTPTPTPSPGLLPTTSATPSITPTISPAPTTIY